MQKSSFGTELLQELKFISKCSEKSPHRELVQIMISNEGLKLDELTHMLQHGLRLNFTKPEIKQALDELTEGGVLISVNKLFYIHIERITQIRKFLEELEKRDVYFEPQ